MIMDMRREFKKFVPVLWVVFVSMALSSLAVVVFRQPSVREIKVATVNGRPIYLNQYRNKIAEVQMQIEMIKNYSRSQGLSPELFLAMYGLKNPAETAFNNLVSSKLFDELQEKYNISLDPEYFKEQLIKAIPRQLLDSQGRINEKYYRDYLTRMGQTIPEYEEARETELKRDIVKEFIKASVYVPLRAAQSRFEKENQRKSFSILEVSRESFLRDVQKEEISSGDLRSFFESNKDLYRIPEKRKAEFWEIPTKEYEKTIIVNDRTIESFYEKNKTSLYRIAPEVKVRKILIKVDSDTDTEQSREATKKMSEILSELKTSPDKFEALVKKYSQAINASKGGVIDFFKRGTYDPVFEKAAFRLKEKGEISGAVRTKDGLELIQLMDRKSASYKPLELVRGDIVEAIKVRKGKNELKSDLQSAIFHSKTDAKAIDKMVAKKHFKGDKTDWLETKDTSGYDKEAVLARRLFDKKPSQENFGFFEFEGNFILFREVGREKSVVPGLDKLKDLVSKDYYSKKATRKQKAFAKQAKREFLAGEKTLQEIAKEVDGKIETTGLIRSGAKVSGVKNSEGLVRKAFELTDGSQLLKSRIGENYYLVQLENTEKVKAEDTAEKIKKALAAEKETKKALNLNAFIASLLRGARIDKDEKTLGNLYK